MTMKDLLEAFKLIEQNIEKCDFQKDPKSEKLIDLAENTLKLKFPPTYRMFLKKYGRGGTPGLDLEGIVNDKFESNGIKDGVGLTLEMRKNYNMPNHFILIASTGDGFWYVLDASEVNSEGEYPVVIWGFGEKGSEKIKTHQDFGELFLEDIQVTLKHREEKHITSQKIIDFWHK